ncbi:MAG TPA: GNAT family N-acetyltransferase [Candidatus Baltobacteraceae bacterium]|nr:GNAT family N-acetyltransferase [Candidatus Baltobacteraceae bacterium]
MSDIVLRRTAIAMSKAGKQVRLRALRPADYEPWLEWINDPAVMDGLDRALPATGEQHDIYIRTNVTDRSDTVWFAVETIEDRSLVGIVWLWEVNNRHRRAEVRIVIDPAASGRGYGPDALRALSEYAFRILGLHKLYAYVHERNARSRAAFERAGFTLEGTLQGEAFWDGNFAAVWRLARFAD